MTRRARIKRGYLLFVCLPPASIGAPLPTLTACRKRIRRILQRQTSRGHNTGNVCYPPKFPGRIIEVNFGLTVARYSIPACMISRRANTRITRQLGASRALVHGGICVSYLCFPEPGRVLPECQIHPTLKRDNCRYMMVRGLPQE
jgi:hypothetical protein